jgi:hypothetical protein
MCHQPAVQALLRSAALLVVLKAPPLAGRFAHGPFLPLRTGMQRPPPISVLNSSQLLNLDAS